MDNLGLTLCRPLIVAASALSQLSPLLPTESVLVAGAYSACYSA